MLLAIENISKAYGNNQVLNQVSFQVNRGQKVGLVGANGVGKSTLLKLIVSEVEADGGSVRLAAGAEIGYLPQVLSAIDQQTIEQLIDATQGHLSQIEARLRLLEGAMAQPQDGLDTLLAEYSSLSEEFERRGGYELKHRTDEIFAGLEISHLPPTRKVATLSGGEKSRVGLAALLLRAPDLLLLDEPTNHLDFTALTWLEEYLQRYKGGVLVVSHDRLFLNRTVESIVEVVEHSKQARLYNGNYDFYANAKLRERAEWVASYWAQQEEMIELRKLIKSKARQNAFARAPRDNDKFAYTFKSEKLQTSLTRNIRSAEERLRRIEEAPIAKPPQELVISPDFDPQEVVSKTPVSVTDISKTYAGQQVLQPTTFSIDPGSRIVLIGPNGAGKSTLFKLIAGLDTPDSGSIQIAPSVVIGYLDQEQATLSLVTGDNKEQTEQTLLDVYRAGRQGDWEEIKAELLQYGLFTWRDLLKPVATLSVGQKRKLQIAQLIAQRANLLLLDEPTNHISLDVLEEFEKALLAFPGPILAISHDRRFIERFAAEIWRMEDGRLSKV